MRTTPSSTSPKRLSYLLALTQVALLLGAEYSGAASPLVATRSIKIDPKRSTLQWTGRKVTGTHTGKVQLKNGELSVSGKQGEDFVSGKFAIDLMSLKDEDLKDASYNAKLVGHLKSADFFDVAKYPEAILVMKHVTPVAGAPAGKPNYDVTGDLTIKDQTHPIAFPATVQITKKQIDARAHITVDRTVWGLKYGSGKFFDNLGDKMIKDEFDVDVRLIGEK